jgi:ribosomal protein S18 acetylase RimI-like enzyme
MSIGARNTGSGSQGGAPGDGGVVVRPYEPADRAQVRRICFETGYMGDSVDWLWRDRESWADMFSGYYTDCEPESALVAEVNGEVVGYLLGCLDSSKAWDPGVVALRHVLRRGIALRPGTARVVWRSAGDILVDAALRRLPSGRVVDPRWPAHLHIDFLPAGRGRGLGSVLVRRWLDTLRDRGCAGCHLGTMAENTSAVAFFEAMGFRREGIPELMPGLRSREGARLHVQLMVQLLGDRSGPSYSAAT